MRMATVVLAGVALLAGCGDLPPEIRGLKYSPNAGIVGVQSSISGSVEYTSPTTDVSQTQTMLYNPSGASSLSIPMPIDNVGQGAVGSAGFTLEFTPDVSGTWSFQVWIIDLKGRPSNILGGILRIADGPPAPTGT